MIFILFVAMVCVCCSSSFSNHFQFNYFFNVCFFFTFSQFSSRHSFASIYHLNTIQIVCISLHFSHFFLWLTRRYLSVRRRCTVVSQIRSFFSIFLAIPCFDTKSMVSSFSWTINTIPGPFVLYWHKRN